MKRQRKEKQLNAHVRLASSQKSAETKVRFQQSKGTLYLDGTAQAQIDAALRGNVLPRGLPQLLQRFVYTQFLRLLNILCLTAFLSQRAALAILAAIPLSAGRVRSPVIFFRDSTQVPLDRHAHTSYSGLAFLMLFSHFNFNAKREIRKPFWTPNLSFFCAILQRACRSLFWISDERALRSGSIRRGSH